MYSFIWFVVFLGSTLFSGPIDQQLDALQQLRTLMPERVWFQEFSILVDQEGFEKQVMEWTQHQRRESTIPSDYAIAFSRDYFLYSTMSGENVRLLDRYQQFEESPFWRTPEKLRRLKQLEKQ